MEDFLRSPEFVSLLGTILTAAVSVAGWTFTRYTGIRIEAERRTALHSAIITGVESVLQDGRLDAADVDLVRDVVKRYLRTSVPDALKALAPADEVIDALIERYLREAAGPAPQALPPR